MCKKHGVEKDEENYENFLTYYNVGKLQGTDFGGVVIYKKLLG